MHHQVYTIKEMLESVASHEFVLPAIQREFVWKPEQICSLFDSLMQGYPFGEFMFWHVEPENSARYAWYDFVREYHQRDKPHCPELPPIHDKRVTAILDGQQRLTAFNIGLRGSMSLKLPYKWWNSSDAFPRRVLALDLLAPPERDEEGNCYTFNFIGEEKIGIDGESLWFKVSEILGLDDGPDMHDWIIDKVVDKEQQKLAFRTLARLHHAVQKDQVVAYYEEKSQDIERVLNIFIRCNRGGTSLSYSDLLLSIAVSQWKDLDARREVHGLVDEMNRVRSGLVFDADFVLKAGLMLNDLSSIRFRVANFTPENMAVLEKNWMNMSQALLETAELVDSFGFDSRTIQANNSLLPIAYYLNRKGAPRDFETSDQYAIDRRAIRNWLTRSILKASGIWSGGQVDTMLATLRDVISGTVTGNFPADELRNEMGRLGRGLSFGDEEIEDLADMKYGDRRIFPLLAMLFPDLGSRNGFDIDHVFPKSCFTLTRLQAARLKDDQISEFRDNCERLANLQLLDRSVNNEKRASLPADWLDKHCSGDARQGYCERHLLGDIPREITGFMEFYKARRERLKEKIAELINIV